MKMLSPSGEPDCLRQAKLQGNAMTEAGESEGICREFADDLANDTAKTAANVATIAATNTARIVATGQAW